MNKLECPPENRRILIGKLIRVRGLQGDLKVLPFTWDPERFFQLDGVWCNTFNHLPRFFTFKRVRVEGDSVYVRFREAPTRELAESLLGADLFLDESERAVLPEDYYYYDDIIGCQIHCSRYGNVGNVQEILEAPAGEIWRVFGEYGEVLIPVIKEFVEKIDTPNRSILVNLPEGLVGK